MKGLKKNTALMQDDGVTNYCKDQVHAYIVYTVSDDFQCFKISKEWCGYFYERKNMEKSGIMCIWSVNNGNDELNIIYSDISDNKSSISY